jgi:hypothetical protein
MLLILYTVFFGLKKDVFLTCRVD